MPNPAQGTLSVVGQVLQFAIGQDGVGQPGDVTAIVGLTGTFSAVIGLEGVPIGSILTQPTQPGPFNPPSASSPNLWTPITATDMVNGEFVSSPITVSSVGGLGSGLLLYFPAALYQLVQVRLISLTSGSIVASIATQPFPLSSGIGQSGDPINQLELSRIRFGISVLLGGGADAAGFNLQDLTEQDFSNFV